MHPLKTTRSRQFPFSTHISPDRVSIFLSFSTLSSVMSLRISISLKLLLGFAFMSIALCRPPVPMTSYFPAHPHPWTDADYTPKTSYVSSSKSSQGSIYDYLDARNDFRPQFPVYSSIEHGFVPSDFSNLDQVYWWKKRFQNTGNGPVEDIPYYDDVENDISYGNYIDGGVNKRDYTAAQLVNMLKAIAKARRHKQIRVAGKALRFGISK